jgi:hypothetical protein
VVDPRVSANAEAVHRNRVTVVGPVTYYARRVLREAVVGCSRTDQYGPSPIGARPLVIDSN